jgi:hypothetical protein
MIICTTYIEADPVLASLHVGKTGIEVCANDCERAKDENDDDDEGNGFKLLKGSGHPEGKDVGKDILKEHSLYSLKPDWDCWSWSGEQGSGTPRDVEGKSSRW